MKKLLFVLLCVMIGCTQISTQSLQFKGEWKQETTEEFNLLKIDLYEKAIKLPDKSDSCFGYLQMENEYYADFWIIDEVSKIDNNSANVLVYSWRYGSPDEKDLRTITYNPTQQTVSWNNDNYKLTLLPTNSNTKEAISVDSKPDMNETTEKSSNTFFIILAVLGTVIGLVIFYYLFKIILLYAVFVLFFGVIFWGVGLFITKLISPDYMFDVARICAYVGGALGLIIGIFNTLDFIKIPFASIVAKEITKTTPVNTKYKIKDEYGNTIKTVKKTGNGVLGETYYKDEDGNSYTSTWGSNQVEKE